MSATPAPDWPDGVTGCTCIHCRRRFSGRSAHIKVCRACDHVRRVKRRLTYYILMERGASKMLVGPYQSITEAGDDMKYWHKRHGWVAHVLPLMHKVRDRIGPRGPLWQPAK